MQCRSCRTELPVGIAYCPTCGVATLDRVSESRISPEGLTAASSSYGASLQAPTDYGSPSYGVPQTNPYEPLNPYDPYSAPIPPPPPSPRRKVKGGLVIGTVALVLILASAGVFVLFAQLAKNNPAGKTTTPPTITPQANLTTIATSVAITATSAVNAEKIPYPPYKGTLVLNDSLHNNGQGYAWEEYPINTYGGACQFAKDGYHVIEQQKYAQACHVATILSNFALEVQMKVIKGNCGGVTFRDDRKISAYHFEVCQDGTYSLYHYDASGSASTLTSSSSSAIKTGLNQSNLLAIVAIGNKFDLYVNRQHIDSASDNTYQQGYIGLRASYYNSTVEVVYSNIKAWTL
jgi:eukaryotic-like serine/threonine-protein kinase